MLQAIDIFSDFVFVMDMVMQSHAAYWDQDPSDGKWLLIDKLDEIRGIYFTEIRPVCTWLCLQYY